MASSTIADLGRAEYPHRPETACFALVREEREGGGSAPRSRASAHRALWRGDVLLGGYLSERFNGADIADALERRSDARPRPSSSSAPDASTRRKRAAAAGVEIHELDPVAA